MTQAQPLLPDPGNRPYGLKSRPPNTERMDRRRYQTVVLAFGNSDSADFRYFESRHSGDIIEAMKHAADKASSNPNYTFCVLKCIAEYEGEEPKKGAADA